MSNNLEEKESGLERKPEPAMDFILSDEEVEKRFVWLRKMDEIKAQITGPYAISIEGKSCIPKQGWRKLGEYHHLSVNILGDPVRAEHEDDEGTYYVWSYRVRITAPWGPIWDSEGAATSRDPFFAKRGGKFRPSSEVEESNIKMKALTVAISRGISDLVGGGEVSYEEMQGKEPLPIRSVIGRPRVEGQDKPKEGKANPITKKQVGLLWARLKVKGWKENKESEAELLGQLNSLLKSNYSAFEEIHQRPEMDAVLKWIEGLKPKSQPKTMMTPEESLEFGLLEDIWELANGLWGDGEARHNKLTKLLYDNFLGFSSAGLLPKDFIQQLHPDGLNKLLELLKEVKKEG